MTLYSYLRPPSTRQAFVKKLVPKSISIMWRVACPPGSWRRKTFESSFYFSNQFGKFLLERKYYFVYTCTMQCYNQNVQDFWIKIFSTWRMDGGIYSQQLEAMNWWKEWSMFLRQQVWSYSNSSPPTHVIVLFIANVTILLIRYLSICPSFIVNISFN